MSPQIAGLPEKDAGAPTPRKTIDHTDLTVCHFCGKREGKGPDFVFNLIVGPAVTICDECVGLAAEMVAEKREQAAERDATSATPNATSTPAGSTQTFNLSAVTMGGALTLEGVAAHRDVGGLDLAPDLAPGKYQHYKGGYYTLIGLVRHHDAGTPYVLYLSHTKGTFNVRPVDGVPGDPDGWTNPALVDGRKVVRFVRVDEGAPGTRPRECPQQLGRPCYFSDGGSRCAFCGGLQLR
jgi:hypothetical protein